MQFTIWVYRDGARPRRLQNVAVGTLVQDVKERLWRPEEVDGWVMFLADGDGKKLDAAVALDERAAFPFPADPSSASAVNIHVERARAPSPAAAGGGAPAAGAAAGSSDVELATVKLARLSISSPTKEVFSVSMRCFRDSPLSFIAPDGVAEAFSSAFAHEPRWEQMMEESTWYPRATDAVPEWVHAEVRRPLANRTAADTYGGRFDVGAPLALELPWECQPELFTRAGQSTPAFNGELKTAGNKRAVDGGVVHVLLGIADALFRGAPERSWRFLRGSPPLGYALLGFPYLAHLVAVEMVGCVFVSPVSLPFVLGSPQHHASVAALHRPAWDADAVVDLPATAQMRSAVPAHGRTAYYWTAHPVAGRFYKVIAALCSEAEEGFLQLYRVYAAYAAAEKSDRPPALLDVELLFGFFSVAVEMPFVQGRHPTEDELASDAVLRPVADAIAWLLRHRLVYVDVRAPNVILTAVGSGGPGGEPERVVLVDLDDCVLLGEGVVTRAGVAAALKHARDSSSAVATCLRLWPGRLKSMVQECFEDS